MLGNLFESSHEPVFLNEGSYHSELVLQKMEALRSVVSKQDLERLERDIALQRSGIAGEKRVAFELKNSHYPLVFLHDLNLEHEGMTAQIDFLVISPYNAFVLECKNLVGDIKVQSDGTFVRTFGTGYGRKREAIYSPVTQNARHVALMKSVIRAENGRLISAFLGGLLDSYFHSVVVLANDKTVLSLRGAPKDVCSQIVRCDQLIEHIKRLDRIMKKKTERDSFKSMEQNARGWLKRSKPLQVDLTNKYTITDSHEMADVHPAQGPSTRSGWGNAQASATQTEVTVTPTPVSAAPAGGAAPLCPVCGSPMQLRTARRGAHKGEQFWGCSTYWTTHCPGILPVNERGTTGR